jgi:signal transduction histidine kinase
MAVADLPFANLRSLTLSAAQLIDSGRGDMTISAIPPRTRSARPRLLDRSVPALHELQEARRHAAGQERHRLAQELHDGVIQQILAAGLTIDWCLAEVPAGSAVHERLEHAKRLASIALRHLRTSLQALAEDPRPDEEDLPDMLRHLLAFPPTCGLDLSVEVTGVPVALPAEVRRSLYQVASECLFNTARHAGARHAVIRLRYGRGVVALSVADDGHGDPEALKKILRGGRPVTGGSCHFGLADITRRAAEMGGTMLVSASDLGGVAVEVLVPLYGGTDE